MIFGSLERQVVGVLIVNFHEHQQHNVNLQKGRSGDNRPIASPMIKSAKNLERKKRISGVGIAYLPYLGTFLTYRVRFTRNPLLPSRGRILYPLLLG